MTNAEYDSGGIDPELFAKALRDQATVADRLGANAEELGRSGAARVAQVVSEGDRGIAEQVEELDEPIKAVSFAYDREDLLRTGPNIVRSRLLVDVVNGFQRILAPITPNTSPVLIGADGYEQGKVNKQTLSNSGADTMAMKILDGKGKYYQISMHMLDLIGDVSEKQL
jgi:hypothetical protein